MSFPFRRSVTLSEKYNLRLFNKSKGLNSSSFELVEKSKYGINIVLIYCIIASVFEQPLVI